MKISDSLVKILINNNIKYVFGVSGANIEHFHDAIYRLGNGKIMSVLAKCESGASFMADCHARIHGGLGVCCATSGAGMVNLIPGIAESFAECSPVLAIIGQPPQELEGKGAFQDSSGLGRTIDAVELFKSCSKFVGKVANSNEFESIVEMAIQSCLTPPMGPSVVLIPRNMFDQVPSSPKEEPLRASSRLANHNIQIFPPSPLPQESEIAILCALKKSSNPVVIIGAGVRRSKLGGYVAQFCSETNLPTATTMSSRAEYPNDAPNYLGTVGMTGNPSAHSYINDACDLIIAVGTELEIMTRAPIANALKEKPVIAINVDNRNLPTIPNLTSITQDPGKIFAELMALNQNDHFIHVSKNNYEMTIFEPSPDLSSSPLLLTSSRLTRGSIFGDQGMRQSDAISILSDFLPQSGHIFFDAGNCAAAAMHLTLVPNGVTSTIALGMGSMGFAIGGSIGAQLGSPSHMRTLAFVGDGGFLMSGLEIHTAVELKLPILFVVFNNGKHGMCVTRQNLYFEGRVEASTFNPVDVAAIARGLANEETLFVRKTSTPQELLLALKEYNKSLHIPGVIEVCVPCEEIPPFSAFVKKDAKIITMKQWKRRKLL